MIKISRANNKSCDNCNREMKIILSYEFFDKGRNKPYVIFGLCEDCSNALMNLHKSCMEDGESYKYDLDEITQMESEE